MKKFTAFLVAMAAALLLTTTASAHGIGVGVHFGGFGARAGLGYGGFGGYYGGYNYSYPVSAFTFSQPVYATTSAYYTYQPFALLAAPPVAVQDPCPPTVTYAAPVPVADPVQLVPTYAGVGYTYGLFGVDPGYVTGSYGYGLGVNRFGTSYYGSYNRNLVNGRTAVRSRSVQRTRSAFVGGRSVTRTRSRSVTRTR